MTSQMENAGEPRIRLYASALNDVRYVYGHPVPFTTDREILQRRHADKHAMILRSRSQVSA